MPTSPFKLSMVAAAVSALFAPGVHAASAGRVEFATAGVNAVAPNGQTRPLTKGSELDTGETVDTGTGRAQLRFTDGGVVSLAPETQFKLVSYGYDKDDSNKNSIVMNLLKGGLRTITGLIGKTNRQGYKLQTATATVGIRGTEFSIVGLPNGTILFNCTDGAVDLTNGSGTTVLPAGRTASVSSPNSAPTTSDQKPFLPPTSYTATLLPQPTNPYQDSTTTSAIPILTGTFTPNGQWRALSFQTGTIDPSGNGNGYGASFTLDNNGHLTTATGGIGNSYGGTFTFTRTDGNSILDGNDGTMAWGRWTGNAVDQNGYGYTFTAADPLHWVAGVPVTSLPTSGTATYTMYGGTLPSCSGGACGVLGISSQLVVNFGSYGGSYSMGVTNSADNAKLSGSGNLYFDNAGINFTGNGSLSGTVGSGTSASGSTQLNGFLAGAAASHAGAVYNINYGPNGYGTSINGAAVFSRGAITPSVQITQ